MIGQYIEYDDKAVGSIGRFLADLVDMLGMAFDSRYEAPKKTVKLGFRFREAGDLEYEQGDTAPRLEGTRLYRNVWYRTQIASAVNKMRKLLRFRASVLSLTTNVETSIFGFRAQKVDDRRVRFQNEGNGDKGIFELWTNGFGCAVGREEETDKDD